MRDKCYKCFRPETSCMCKYVSKIETKSKFIILMHPMERQKVKNNTGFLTHQSLPNSILIEGIDFSDNDTLNKRIKEDDCYLLYPSNDAKPIAEYTEVVPRGSSFIIIDATWPCAKKILRLSPNLKKCKPLSFSKTVLSEYIIKQQPKDGYISTIETAKVLIEEMIDCNLEKVSKDKLSNFLLPFKKINEYQVDCINDPNKPTYSARALKRK